MPLQFRVYANEEWKEPKEPNGKPEIVKVEDTIGVSGEFTELQTVEFALMWKEGTRVRASTARAATLTLKRRLENADSDVLADLLMAGPKQNGEPFVVPFRAYEIDTAELGWLGVVNEWRIGRGVVTSSRIFPALDLQLVTIICTDIQLAPSRGKQGPSPDVPLSDPTFLQLRG